MMVDIRQDTDSIGSLSDLDQNNSSRIDDGFLEDEPQGALDMGGPSYVQPDATKEDQYLQHCLDTRMQNNYFDMTNFQGFPQSLGRIIRTIVMESSYPTRSLQTTCRLTHTTS